MSFFRSEDMGLFKLQLKTSDAKEILEKFGDFSCLHFIDVFEGAENRSFSELVHRCNDIKVAIKYIEQCCNEHEIPLKNLENWADFVHNSEIDIAHKGKSTMTYFEETEKTLLNAIAFFRSECQKMIEAKEDLKQILEKICVFKAASKIIELHNL